MSIRLPAFFSIIVLALCPFTYADNPTSDSGHRVEQSALVASEKNSYNVTLPMECTPLDIPVVTFDQTVKSRVTVTGNEIKFNPALNEGVGITATYTCP